VRGTAKFLLKHFERRILSIYQHSELGKLLMLGAERAIRKTPTGAELEMLGREVSYSTDKAAARLGFAPRVALGEGVARSVQWLRHHGYAGDPPSP
jgi:nucleoside-diphosphate-sugar epimerase